MVKGIQVHSSDSDLDSGDVISQIKSSKGKKKQPGNDLEKYSWSDDDDCSDESDDDDSDGNGDMFYGSDSDVSLGSIVDSDDLDDTYECESTDESMDGYEMKSSDDSSEFDESDHSNYSYSESQSSHDTYDEFLNSRHCDSSNDDQDFNGKCFKLLWKREKNIYLFIYLNSKHLQFQFGF